MNKLLRLGFLLAFILIGPRLFAADRYWVLGSGNWDASDTTHWSTTSGGAGGASVPTSVDNVISNTLSNATAHTITIAAAANCLDLTLGNPLAGVVTLAGTAALNISGSSSLATGALIPYTGDISYKATSGTKTITSNGATLLSNVIFNGVGGTFQLADALTMGGANNLTWTAGTFDPNGKAINLVGTSHKIIATSVYPQPFLFYDLTRTGTAHTTDSLTLYSDINVTGTLTVNGNSSTNRMLLNTGDVNVTMGLRKTIHAAAISMSNVDIQDVSIPHNVIIAMGDSITGQSYPMFLEDLLSASPGIGWGVVNKGVSGNTTTQMVARFTVDVLNIPNVSHVIIEGGVNDCWNDVSAATIEANLQTMYTAAHNAGIVVIATTITPFGQYSSWSAPRQTVHDAVNTWIKTTAINVDYIVDLYSALQDPANPYNYLPANDCGDHLHPSRIGHHVIANDLYSAKSWSYVAGFDISAIAGLSGNCGGNAGLVFTASANQYYYKTSGNALYSTVANWYLGSGGTGGAGRVPLSQDMAIYDSATFGTAMQQITLDMPRIASTNMIGVTHTPLLIIGNQISIFGSLLLDSGTNNINGTSIIAFEGRGSYILNTGGLTVPGPIQITNPYGTMTLGANLTITNTLQIYDESSFVLGGYNLTATYFFTRRPYLIDIRNSVFILSSYSASYVFYMAPKAGTETSVLGGTIKLTDSTANTKIFVGDGVVYPNIWLAPGASAAAYNFTGSGAFANFKDDGTAAHSILFTAGTTTTVKSWNVSGHAGAVITIGSITAAGHTLSVTNPCGVIQSDYLSISYSTATQTSRWYAGANSTDGGNNSNWVFTAGPVAKCGGGLLTMGVGN